MGQETRADGIIGSMRCRIPSLAVAFTLSLLPACRGGSPARAPKPGLDGPYEVTKVVDGDTIHVSTSSGASKVRFVVRAGWSAYYTKYGVCPGYHVRFLEAEEDARTAGAGIWAHSDFLDGGYLQNARGGAR
jgi:endonuclease YncB( thermonuclease family)